jgi:hypothetical protein
MVAKPVTLNGEIDLLVFIENNEEANGLQSQHPKRNRL